MRFYENLENIFVNRLPQRSYYIPENNGAYTLLNGEWKFKYFKIEEDYCENITDWDKIPVPSCWQMYGYEDPNYTNVNYPYPVDPPYVPDDNPMGVYEREFTVENTDNRTYIVFEGVSSCVFLYINGEFAGYSQGSHLQAEFDVTSLVKKGTNTLRAKVMKWCLGSYLEDQDFFRMNGIFRDVYLLSRPEGHIKDIEVRTENNNINIKFDGEAEIVLEDNGKVLSKGNFKNNASFTVENPTLWNAEKPYLYTLTFTYKDEVIKIKTGFRKYEISDKNEFLVNGVAVKLKGVNHHDTDAFKGWYQTDEEFLNDIKLMKKLNMNTVRTSHYPPHPKFLNMCDEIGLYVILETDLETHGFTTRVIVCGYDNDNPDWLHNQPKWKEAYLERMIRAYERDKNHPSIIMWSTGNESGHGDNHFEMIKYVKGRDKNALIHSEDASRLGYWKRTDVFSIMYPDIEDTSREGKPDCCNLMGYVNNAENKQPYFMCEYAHAMGNGPGSVKDYWDIIYKYPFMIGGCVWEWADHTVIKNGVPLYGGDFDEGTHDHNFCSDGLVFYDRSLKSGSYEVKRAYQYMKSELSQNMLKVTNLYDFTNLNEYTFKVELYQDKKAVCEKDFALDIMPKESKTLDISEILGKAGECQLGTFINIYLYDKDGEEVAWEQHVVNIKPIKASKCEKYAELKEENGKITAEGNDFKYTFSKKYGNFESMIIKGTEQLCDTVKLTMWRAPTDNERHDRKMWEVSNQDNYSGMNINKLFSKVYECEIKDGKIFVTGSLAGISRKPVFRYTALFEVFEDGRIDISLNGKISEEFSWIPRLGFEFKTIKQNDKFEYFGRGAGENYCDLYGNSKIGYYESCAENEYVNYIKPQEHGNHTNAKLLKFENGLEFTGENFEFNVSEYDSMDITKSKHINELCKNGVINTRIDFKNSGIGSHSCGPELFKQHRFSQKDVDFKFCVKF